MRLWDTGTGERVRTLVTNPRLYNSAQAIAFSPDGANLARNAGDDTIRVLRVSDSALVASYRGAKPSSYSLAYSPDGQWLATPGPTAVAIWRIADGASGPSGFTGRAGSAPTALAFSKDGTRLVVGDSGGGVSLWAFPSGARVAEFAAGTAPIEGIAFSLDGTRLTVRSFALTALYAVDGTQVSDLARASGSSFSSDGAYLASVGVVDSDSVGRSQLGVWLRSPATGLPSMRIALAGDPSQLFGGAFAPGSHRLAVIGLSWAQILCLP